MHLYFLFIFQVVMYTTFQLTDIVSVSARRLVDYYSNRKSGLRFIVRPLVPPTEYRSSRRRKLEYNSLHPELISIAFNDCLLRFSHDRHVTHVAPSIGVEELLVPRQVNLNYSAMLNRMEPAKRSLVSLRGTTFSTDAEKAVEADAFLTTIRFRSRDKMSPTERHLVDPRRCSLLSQSGTCIELTPDGGTPDESDIFGAPPAFGAWHRYRACSEEERKQCAAEKDNALMRFQKQLKLNVVQAIKDSGMVTNEEEIHQVALRL
jgi:hypothetical protein